MPAAGFVCESSQLVVRGYRRTVLTVSMVLLKGG
jgi:hypothetical protein